MESKELQQGDVILVPVSEIPSDAKPRKNMVLKEGEGHNVHVMEAPVADDVEVFEREGRLFVRVKGDGAKLVHRSISGGVGEHASQVVAPGLYEQKSVQEWDPWRNEGRNVQD